MVGDDNWQIASEGCGEIVNDGGGGVRLRLQKINGDANSAFLNTTTHISMLISLAFIPDSDQISLRYLKQILIQYANTNRHVVSIDQTCHREMP